MQQTRLPRFVKFWRLRFFTNEFPNNRCASPNTLLIGRGGIGGGILGKSRFHEISGGGCSNASGIGISIAASADGALSASRAFNTIVQNFILSDSVIADNFSPI
jgi:hypothetical protein